VVYNENILYYTCAMWGEDKIMMEIKDLSAYRKEIDAIDKEFVELFARRMEVASAIGRYKKENGLPVLDAARERAKLGEVADMAPPDMQEYTKVLYSLLFELSRSHQEGLQSTLSPLFEKVKQAVDTTPLLFPEDALVACQGTEGAYSTIAAEKMFHTPRIMYCKSFEAVMQAVENGLCRYGMLPVENSTAGIVQGVYKLLEEQHDIYIVRAVRVKVDHNLLGRRGTKLENIREVISHEQAISQCSTLLESLGVKITYCENTAVAAKMVAESGRDDLAALSSSACAAQYGLNILKSAAQNVGNNYTRFVCISKNLEIYPGSDRTTLMLETENRPGALYKLLARFYARGINLTSLVSRPIPEREFTFRFYFDLDTSVYADSFAQLLCELDSLCPSFHYLGSYREIV